MAVPVDPQIFHITHVDNLPGIVREGGIWCDAERQARALKCVNIGHVHIKQRRLSRVVTTAAGGTLGEYVPFNFCPRSVMLYVLHQGHQDYNGGQEPIVHLVSSVSRATALLRAWAFTDRHAELAHALFFDDLNHLSEVAWDTMTLKYWREVKEERQAEFLVKQFFPWAAITEVVAMSSSSAESARTAMQGSGHRPLVTLRREWYY